MNKLYRSSTSSVLLVRSELVESSIGEVLARGCGYYDTLVQNSKEVLVQCRAG